MKKTKESPFADNRPQNLFSNNVVKKNILRLPIPLSLDGNISNATLVGYDTSIFNLTKPFTISLVPKGRISSLNSESDVDNKNSNKKKSRNKSDLDIKISINTPRKEAGDTGDDLDIIIEDTYDKSNESAAPDTASDMADVPGCLSSLAFHEAWSSKIATDKLVPKTSTDSNVLRQLKEAENRAKHTAKLVEELKNRLCEIQKKSHLTDADTVELIEKNEELRKELVNFDDITRQVQKLLGTMDLSTDSFQRIFGPEITLSHPPTIPNMLGYGHHESISKSDNNLPRVILCGPQDDVMPRVVLCETSKSDINLTRKLSDSYNMQERLAADNADLEEKRYQLHRELLLKDQSLDIHRRQLKRLQSELKLLVRENGALNEKIKRNNPEGDSAMDARRPICPGDVTERLQQYNATTSTLVKQLGKLEDEMKDMQTELSDMRGDREVRVPSKKPCHPVCEAVCNPDMLPLPSVMDNLKLKEQLNRLEDDHKSKISEVAILRTNLVKVKGDFEKEKKIREKTESKLLELEAQFAGLVKDTNQMLGSKEQMLEQEQSVQVLKQRYFEAKEEIDEMRQLIGEQTEQLQEYRIKYLQAQQTVEEQKRQLEMMELDNARISEQINLEIQKVKLQFQERLQELSPLPDILKNTQLKLQEAQQLQMLAEHNAQSLARELQTCREKVHLATVVVKPQTCETQTKAPKLHPDKLLQQKLYLLQDENAKLMRTVDKLRSNIDKLDQQQLETDKHLQTKLHECSQIGGELETLREESARTITRAKERTETVRQCLQAHISELEKQLVQARAAARSAQKDRDSLRQRMQQQINNLNDSFGQAQMRIHNLQSQVGNLQTSVHNFVDDGPCDCSALH